MQIHININININIGKLELPTDIGMKIMPLMELLTLAEDIHAKTQETSQKTNLDMQNFLGINKALQMINGELINNDSKLSDS